MGSSPAASVRRGHGLAGFEDVCAVDEDCCDGREALDGIGAEGGEAAHAVNDVLEGAGDEGFDLFGGKAGGFGLDDNLRRDEIGEDVELSVVGIVDAVTDDEAGQQHNHAAKTQGEFHQPSQHERSGVLCDERIAASVQ